VTSSLRLEADVAQLRSLATASRGRVEFERFPSEVRPEVVAVFACVAAGSPDYPSRRETRVVVHVALPERYPFMAPVATVRTPIWHPNVFASGTICLGTRWIAAQGLDLFVERLLRLLTFDPLLVNTASPANRDAASWYEQRRREYPGAFPTDRLAVEQLVERIVLACPACGRGLRLPRGRSGTVRCPSCGTVFEAQS
jgi:ubiquitin-protein ligase